MKVRKIRFEFFLAWHFNKNTEVSKFRYIWFCCNFLSPFLKLRIISRRVLSWDNTCGKSTGKMAHRVLFLFSNCLATKAVDGNICIVFHCCGKIGTWNVPVYILSGETGALLTFHLQNTVKREDKVYSVILYCFRSLNKEPNKLAYSFSCYWLTILSFHNNPLFTKSKILLL